MVGFFWLKKRGGNDENKISGVEVIYLNYSEKFSKFGYGNYVRYVERE